METLVKPNPRALKTYTWTCKNTKCNARMRAREDEGKFETSPRNESYMLFICPHCQTQAYVDSQAYDRPASSSDPREIIR